MTGMAVLVSGTGTNLEAILQACEQGRLPGVAVKLVVSNQGDAGGIQRAVSHGVPVVYFPLSPYGRSRQGREGYDAQLARIVSAFDAEWVVLAGWMHVLGMPFLKVFPSRVINLHPALPGTFPGTDGIRRAFEAYREGTIDHTGVMVHLVPDEGVDSGPVLSTETVPILPSDSLEDLEARIHAVEHRLLVQTIGKVVGTS